MASKIKFSSMYSILRTEKGFQVRTIENGKLVHTLPTKRQAEMYIAKGTAWHDCMEYEDLRRWPNRRRR